MSEWIKMKIKVVLEPQEEGGYTVYVPSLPGCVSQGETVDEALKNIKEAISLYIELEEDDLVDLLDKKNWSCGDRCMTKLPIVSGKDTIKVLRKIGFVILNFT